MQIGRGNWYGKKYYFGMHYDLHANANDTELGTHCSPAELVPMLKIMKPDFVQTDCKGHPGMTSWFTQVPDGTVSPGVVKDAMAQWREATKQLKLPLHCHYSGIWDMAAAKKHPEWTVMPAPGSDRKSEKMCPRSPYLEKLLIPQLFELIDRYGVDGFWIDGDLWAVEPCYCKKCTAEFKKRTGIAEPPVSEKDANWTAWMNFQRESFMEYVTKYTEAVHAHKPDVKVCSNWLQTLRNPGDPSVSTDWISGDNSWIWGLDGSRCEARWLCNRDKPWDIMLWSFSKSSEMGDPASPWIMKPVEMLEQEAAMLLSTGGNVQIYETCGLRSGQLVPWRMERLGEVSKFVKQRRKLCQDTQTFPLVAVLHSETHYYSQCTSASIMYGYDIAPVQGATWILSDCHYGVDILDEYMLEEMLEQFPVVVVPEQTRMSDKMVKLLKAYVKEGGCLLLTGVGMAERFGYDYLDVQKMETVEKATYYLPVGKKEMFPLYSGTWGLVTTAKASRAFGKLGSGPLRNEKLTDYPVAVFKRHGYGTVAFMPADICRDYQFNRYPETRKFMKELMDRLFTDQVVMVDAPVGLDFVARCGDNGLLFHFINRTSGNPTRPGQGMVEEIPPLGPVKLTLRMGWKPELVKWHFEDEAAMTWTWTPVDFDGEAEHEHDEHCDCGHDHEHGEKCDCGHHHEHGEKCNCGHDHEDGDDCCGEILEGESGVLEVTLSQVKLHGVVQVL